MADEPRGHTREDELFAAGMWQLYRRYSDPKLTAGAVAEALRVSEKTLFRAFAHVGFKSALLELRMAEAELLLGNTVHSVATVARLAGFSSPSAFSHRFKSSHQGKAPAEWRVANGGRARSGPATGAFWRPAARARAERRGEHFVEPRHFDSAGAGAILDVEIREAGERLAARGVRSASIEGLTREIHRAHDEGGERREGGEGMEDDDELWAWAKRREDFEAGAREGLLDAPSDSPDKTEPTPTKQRHTSA